MSVEILAVGTEILLGDILNTNAVFLSKEMAKLGLSVYRHSVVGDNCERLRLAFESGLNSAGLIITTGGLGPTGDDITESVAREVLKDCTVTEIENTNGVAPGLILEKEGKCLILLPGPPAEMETMFPYLIPYLRKFSKDIIISKTIHLAGIGESQAEQAIKDLIRSQTNPTIAPYAKSTGGVIFRITAKASSESRAYELIEPIKTEVYNRLGEFIFGEDGISLEEALIFALKKKNLTLSTAESITGGKIISALINVKGASECVIEGLVCYSDSSKISRQLVTLEELKKHGSGSPQTALAMATNIRLNTGADIGLSATGHAEGDNPVAYIGIDIKGKACVTKCVGRGLRSKVRDQVTTMAVDRLRKML